jgi:hypothetical protein
VYPCGMGELRDRASGRGGAGIGLGVVA